MTDDFKLEEGQFQSHSTTLTGTKGLDFLHLSCSSITIFVLIHQIAGYTTKHNRHSNLINEPPQDRP